MLAALAGCERSPVPVPELRFRVGYPDLPGTLLVYVARDNGLFAAERLQVEANVFPTGREALSAALDGQLDAAVVYSTPLVLAAMRGEDVVVVSTLHRAEGLTGLALNPRTGIRTPSDLGGHRIGFTPATSSELSLEVSLAEGGLEPADVQGVPGQPRELMAALRAGELDAASLWVPNLLVVGADQPNPPRLLLSDVYTEMSMLAGVRSRLEARRTETVRFLRALLKAQEMIRRRPELVRTTLRPRFPQLTSEQLETVISRSRYELGLSNLLLSTLRQEAAWLEARGEVRDQRVHLRDLVAPGILEELEPEAVTLLTPPERRFR